jgi:hypothetical protein
MTRTLFLVVTVLTGLLGQVRIPAADALVLNRERVPLRSGTVPEWAEFATSNPGGARLDLRFTAFSNTTEATLFLRQDDVRHDWFVELNGRRIGQLFLMEADLIQTLAVPAGALKNGSNLLSILPPRENDDIVLREIHLDPRPLTDALREAAIQLRVTDSATAKELPCRITIVNEQNALAPLAGLGDASMHAVRPGVVYTGNGRAEIGLPAGEYTVYASRGFEWSIATQRVQVLNGRSVPITLQLDRVVPTPGWVSCDPHVHTFTHSRHGDATAHERMLTLAGENIELPVATEHNLHVDYAEAAQRAGVATHFTPVAGNEVTTPAGHFNIFPVDPAARVVNSLTTEWPALMKNVRATPRVRVVVLNHPRSVHSNFQPFAATNFNAVSGDNLRGPEFTFDAMELLNSSAQLSDYLLVYRDWFALLNHGSRITAVGSSDGHDVSRYIVGQARTYIAGPDHNPGAVDIAAACSNLLAGRALVSMGLLVDMTVNERFGVGDTATHMGTEVRVRVDVMSPPWASPTNVSLFANGLQIRAQKLGGKSETVLWTLPRPKHDVHLVAIATGPGIAAPYWPIPKPYQPTSPRWEGRVIASTNPIWLDADGDGKFSAARVYARRLIAEAGGDTAKLLAALNGFDETVSVQAASLMAAAGQPLDSPQFVELLKSASDQVQRGVRAFTTASW